MKKVAFIFPFLAGVFWGTSGTLIRVLDASGFSNITILGSRLAIAIPILFIFILIKDKSLLKVKLKDAPIIALVGIFGTMIVNLCLNASSIHLTLSFSTILLSMTPMFVMPMAFFIYKEEITRKKIFCVLIAFLGCVLLSGVLESNEAIKLSTIGLIAGIASAIFNAIYTLVNKNCSKRGYSAVTISFYSFVTVFILISPIMDWDVAISYAMRGPTEVSMLLMQTLLCAIFPSIFYTIGLKHVESGKCAILATSEPVAATILGIIFFSEIPTALNSVGIIISIFALVFLVVGDKKKGDN